MAQVSELPYIIGAAILFLVIIGLTLWMMDLYRKVPQCQNDPNFWCYNTWYCLNDCTTGGADPCFANATADQVDSIGGLAACLYGSESVNANLCEPPDMDTTDPACDCRLGTAGDPTANPPVLPSANCFAGCPQTLSQVTGSTCCCAPGSDCTAVCAPS